MTDPVNHPPHYEEVVPGLECIQITEHCDFCRGNSIKYLWRADYKGKTLEDLRKSLWYVDRLLEREGDHVEPLDIPDIPPERVLPYFRGPRQVAMTALWFGDLPGAVAGLVACIAAEAAKTPSWGSQVGC